MDTCLCTLYIVSFHFSYYKKMYSSRWHSDNNLDFPRVIHEDMMLSLKHRVSFYHPLFYNIRMCLALIINLLKQHFLYSLILILFLPLLADHCDYPCADHTYPYLNHLNADYVNRNYWSVFSKNIIQEFNLQKDVLKI